MNVPMHFVGKEDAPGTEKAAYYLRLYQISKSLAYHHYYLSTYN